MRGRLAIALVALLAAGADAYRGLASCPDLLPLGPPASDDPGVRRCWRALARAGERYTSALLAAHAECTPRLPAGADPSASCRVGVRLSTGEAIPPSDARAAARAAAAERRAEASIAKRCPDAVAAGLASCAATGAGLARCVLADHREHVEHLFDAQHGEAAARADRAAARCHSEIAAAGQRLVTAAMRAHARCLEATGASVNGSVLARRCLGSVENGRMVEPGHTPTALSIRRAATRLERRVNRRCPADAVARLDACAGDVSALPACLECIHRREAILLAQAVRGGTPDRAATSFIDWAALRNPPVLGLDDRALKDQSVARGDDWRAQDGFFYLTYAGSLDGTRFDLRGHGKIGIARSRDLVHWRVAGDLRD